MMLRPFFLYFGGKFRSARCYPPPIYRSLVEPFAGSAGYALRYPDREVVLVEKNTAIAGVWRYLIGASEAEIRGLPRLAPGQHVDDVRWPCPEARDLAGLWLNPGGSAPRRTAGNWTSPGREFPFNGWKDAAIDRIARQQEAIRHWQILEADYSAAPDVEASWFIDPPYVGMGKHYPCGADGIDFEQLANWCRARRGQVLVCEQAGADWLPFSAFGAFKSNKRAKWHKKKYHLSPTH